MRRHAYGCIASGAVLFAASALGVMGTWATLVAVLMITVGAFALAIAMEDAMEDVPTRVPLTVATPLRPSGSGPDLAA